MLCPFSQTGPPTAADSELGRVTERQAADQLRRKPPSASVRGKSVACYGSGSASGGILSYCANVSAVRDTKDVVAMATSHTSQELKS